MQIGTFRRPAIGEPDNDDSTLDLGGIDGRARQLTVTSGWATNSDFDVNCSAGLNRRSNPIVDPGLPLRPFPQAAPPKCAGKTSIWSGSFKSAP